MGAAKEYGADVVKQWNSALDGKTRKSHQELDGQIKELEQPFEVGGHGAMYPGGFGLPSEDCRCRCAILQRARWALDEGELETLKERAAYYGLGKSDKFEDFKGKYLQAASTLQNEQKSTTISKTREILNVAKKRSNEGGERQC